MKKIVIKAISLFLRTFLVANFFVQFSLSASAIDYESPPTLKAEDILDANLRKGKYHSVDQQVKNDGFMNHYTIHSRYGDFNAQSNFMLQKRIGEIYAIHALQSNYPSAVVASNAISRIAKGILMAPINTAKKISSIISEPAKIGETLKGIPKGVENIFGAATSTITEATDFDSENENKQNHQSEQSNGIWSDIIEYIENATLDYVKYNHAYRELSKVLKVDPYTDNKVLSDELSRVAQIEAGAHIASKFIPGIPGLPYLGSVQKYYGYAEKVAIYEDPREAEKLSLKALRAIKRTPSDSSYIQSFFKNPYFTPATRRIISADINRLKDVKNVSYLVKLAALSQSRESVQFYVQSVHRLAENHSPSAPLKAIVTATRLVAAVDNKDVLLLPLPVDYLIWSEKLATDLKLLNDQAMQKFNSKSIRILLSGRLSKICKQALEQKGNIEIEYVPA